VARPEALSGWRRERLAAGAVGGVLPADGGSNAAGVTLAQETLAQETLAVNLADERSPLASSVLREPLPSYPEPGLTAAPATPARPDPAR
jgi:hypothetical protein